VLLLHVPGMQPLVYTPTYEVFLVIDSLRSNFLVVAPALSPVDASDAPPLLGADVYYRAETDICLVALRFDERRMGSRELSWLHELASGAGLPVLDPQRLSDDDRRGFYQAYLGGYELRLEDFGSVRQALRELGRQLGLASGRADSYTEAPKRLPTPAQPAWEDVPEAADGPDTERVTVPPEPMIGPAQARGKERAQPRPATVPETPLARTGNPTARNGNHVRRVATGSGQHPALADPETAPGLEVRYLRGDTWVPARLRALSVRGAYLVAGGLPRQGEWVHLALSFRGTSAVIAGIVHHVTSIADAATTGSSGFSVKFPSDDSAEHRQLVALLQEARGAGVTLRPPPSRVNVRFPVRWPIRISYRDGGFAADALDVSARGMFVHTGHALVDEVAFRVPLDSDDTPLNGRARVVRRVNPDVAVARGLAGGYGLSITELGDFDAARWSGFLERIRCRTERRVLVAALRERARPLRDALAATGYAAAAATDLAMLYRFAEAQPPDALVVDDLLIPPAERATSLDRFAGVQVISAGDDPPQHVRRLVDIALGVPLPH